jgi:hypothetical protein
MLTPDQIAKGRHLLAEANAARKSYEITPPRRLELIYAWNQWLVSNGEALVQIAEQSTAPAEGAE